VQLINIHEAGAHGWLVNRVNSHYKAFITFKWQFHHTVQMLCCTLQKLNRSKLFQSCHIVTATLLSCKIDVFGLLLSDSPTTPYKCYAVPCKTDWSTFFRFLIPTLLSITTLAVSPHKRYALAKQTLNIFPSTAMATMHNGHMTPESTKSQ